MKIFLDIDGVMVPLRKQLPTRLKDDFPIFSSESVSALNKLINDETEIILTTSHKSRFSISEWKNIFKARGIEIKNLSRLDDTECLNRRDEILKWFDTNGLPDKYIILDDDKSLNDLPPGIKEHLILTSSMIGLKENMVS